MKLLDGKWYINKKGYIEGRTIDILGNKRMMKYHRHVMEMHIGRKLTINEDVHHKDGCKTNNKIYNLEIIMHGEHTALSNKHRVRIKGRKMILSDNERERRSRIAKEMNLYKMGHEKLKLMSIEKATGKTIEEVLGG